MFSVNFSIHNLEFFLLILVRVSTMIAIAPIFGNRTIPAKVKVGLAVFLSAFIAMIYPYHNLEYDTVLEYAVFVAKEAVAGLMIGFSANIATYIVDFSGKIIDIDIGFSMVQLFDPNTMQNSSVFGSFYNYLVMLIMLISNMHYFIIQAITDSFGVIPIGGLSINKQYIYHHFIRFMGDYFIIGFRIVLPVFASMLLLNIVLGILAKSAPQMNMFVVGMQLKILLGLAVMVIVIAFLPTITDYIYDAMKDFVTTVIKGMY